MSRLPRTAKVAEEEQTHGLLLQPEEEDEAGCDSRSSTTEACSAWRQGSFGTLALRTADGFARNMVFANQVDVFQRFAQQDQNAAQQQAKLLSAVCSSTPLLVGLAVSRWGWRMQEVVLAGLGLEALGISVLASGAAGSGSPLVILPALYMLYALGYGAVTSTLPVIGMQEVAEELRPAFSQRFFACLAAGSILGILAAGCAQVLNAYSCGFALAVAALVAGGLLFRIRGAPSSVTAVSSESTPSAAGGGGWKNPWPLLALVPFYSAYLQWTTSWYVQASAMDDNLCGYHIPVCFLQAVERVTALVLLLLLGWHWSASGRDATPACRLSLGCLLAGLALLAAGAVEAMRRAAPRLSSAPGVSSLHMVCLVPQFCLIAAAEALVFPAQAEWASGSPLLIGLGTAAQAVAAALLGLAMPHMKAWVPATSINDGYYEYFYGAIAAACFASAALLAATPARSWDAMGGA